jgi:hypothetical protein
MKLQPLQPGQVYVAVREKKHWEEYPLPVDLVTRSTILSIFRSENTSAYALVFYNFSQSTGLVKLEDIHIFDWEAARQRQSGLAPAYV